MQNAIKKISVSRSDRFEGWPTMVKLKNEDLLCVFTRCNGHGDRDNTELMYTVSRDMGESWSSPVALTEKTYNSYYYNNARIRRMGDKIVIVCDMLKSENKEGRSDVFLWISEDEGKSWSQKIKTAAGGIVPDIKQLKNGNWLLTAHRTDEKTKKLVQYGYISSDKGKTWSEEITVAQDLRYNLCEASVLECEDGTLVAFMRENSFEGIDCLKTVSTDGGYTWSEVYKTPILGCHRPTVGYLRDGRVFMTYRFLQGGKFRGCSSENTFMAIMDSESPKLTERRQQSSVIIPLDTDRSENPDSGYTDWVQFKDGTLYIVNYIVDDWQQCQIRGYRVNLEKLLF